MQDNSQRWWKRRLLGLLGIILAGTVLAVILSLIAVQFLINLWWFDSLGYGFYFWQRLFYRYTVFAAVTLVFFLIFFLNFRIASRFLGTTEPSSGTERRGARMLQRFRTGSSLVYTPLSLALAVLIALPLFRNWEGFLFYVFGPQSGVFDPVYGKDISYYLFSYPIYTLIQGRLLTAFLVLLAGLTVIYRLEHRLLAKYHRELPAGALRHISLLILIVFLIETWDLALQRYGLVYTTSHEPLFFGPGFIEMWIISPLIFLEMLLLLATALAVIFSIHKRKGFTAAAGLAGCFLLVFGLRQTTLLQSAVEKYLVRPNEIARERPFITNSVQATLNSYNLTQVINREYRRERMPLDISATNVKALLRNVPLWDQSELDDVYQLQELRTYYSFPIISVGRYTIEDNYQQVFLAGRELDYGLLPGPARNWINRHLTYTHGYGVVMTPASQGGGEPVTWFLQGIPLSSDVGLQVKRPEIYYGLGTPDDYVIAPNDAGELDYPRGDSFVISNYSGRGGVPISSLFSRLLFAYYYGEKNILISTEITDQSRLMFRRNIVERIRTLAPFFLLDHTPYLAITADKLYWIQDAYTTSDRYPNAEAIAFNDHQFNYIRNSLKIIVDAYNGTVDFYIVDPDDPIIKAYSRIYPGLFKDLSSLPGDLKPHLRYPKDVFEVQMRIYAKYHQTNPETFYQQEDLWEFAETLKGEKRVEIQPYFLTLDLIAPGELDFLLMQPMTPHNRDNLRALAVAGCDGANYGKIIVYNFPKGELVYSPVQMEALINADPEIVRQFTLWNQAQSRIERGKMIILPTSKNILYIQPIYLRAEAQLQIPELQRVVMTDGQVAVMEPSLIEAYSHLSKRVGEVLQQLRERFPPVKQGDKAN